jgi:PAS domain-containing protein
MSVLYLHSEAEFSHRRFYCCDLRPFVILNTVLNSYLVFLNHVFYFSHRLSIGCETWSLTFREERRLRVFENRVFRRIFGPKSDEVRGEWNNHNREELHDLNSSPTIVRVIKSKRMRWAGHVAGRGGERRVQGFGGET